MHNFRRLEVWREAMEIAERTYRVTSLFPSEERFGLAGQMRSAAVSISSNIAEGAGRGGPKEMARFLRMAIGSAAELESQFELAARLGMLDEVDELLSQLTGLRNRILRLHDRLIGDRL